MRFIVCLSYVHVTPPFLHRTKKAHQITKSNVLSFYFVSVLIKQVRNGLVFLCKFFYKKRYFIFTSGRKWSKIIGRWGEMGEVLCFL